jgi:hypothetical protein
MPARRGPGAFRPSSLSFRAVTDTPAVPHGGQAGLLRALLRQLGNEASAKMFLREVLGDSGYDAVPEARDAYQTFVREEVLPRLLPLVRLEQMHDLVRRTIGEEGSLHPFPLKPHGSVPTPAAGPKTRPRVVVVERDAYKRIQISKALVGAGFDVEVVPATRDVHKLEAFHALVMPLDADGERVVQQLVSAKTRAGLVLYDDPVARAAIKRTIDGWPSDRVALVARDAPPAALCARVRIVVT